MQTSGQFQESHVPGVTLGPVASADPGKSLGPVVAADPCISRVPAAPQSPCITRASSAAPRTSRVPAVAQATCTTCAPRAAPRTSRGPAAPADLTSCSRGSALHPRRMGSPTVLPAARANPQHLQILHLLRQWQRRSAAISAGETAAPADLTSFAAVAASCHRTGMVTYSAPGGAGGSACSTCRPGISCGICSATPSRRMWSPTVRPPGLAKVLAAAAALTPLAADAAPCHRTGYGRLQCCLQHVRECQQHQ